MSKPLPPPLYLQSAIQKRLGLSAADFLHVRHAVRLKKDADYALDGRQIVLTAGALQALLTHLGSASDAVNGFTLAHFAADQIAPPQKKEAPAARELQVVRIYPNRRLLVAQDAEQKRVDVRVKDNINFVPGMKLRARPLPAPSTHFEMEGRCPRFRGRY